MRQSNELSEQVGAVTGTYHAKYPNSAHFISYPNVKELIEFCNMDIGYIEQAIMSLSKTTKEGEIPRFEWVSAAVKNNFKKKVANKPNVDLQCVYTPHQQIMINEWALPKDLIIDGIDPAIMAEIFDHLLITEQITEDDHRLGMLGIKVFAGEVDNKSRLNVGVALLYMAELVAVTESDIPF